MTTSPGITTAPSQEPAAAVRGDLIMPRDPGYDDAPPQAGQPETGRRRWAVLAVVSAAQFLIILDLWVVNIALPALQHDFAPATLSDVSWILDVYAIVLAALLLPAGRAADSIGRRECFLAGLVVFGIASLGCARGPAEPGPRAPSGWDRATLAHPALTGLPRNDLDDLAAALAGPWSTQREQDRHQRRGSDRQRAPGAGPSQTDARRPGPGHPPAPAPRPSLPPAGPAARGEPDHHQPGSPTDPAATGPAQTRPRRTTSGPPPHTGRHLRVRRTPRHHAHAGIEISVLILCEPLARSSPQADWSTRSTRW